MRSNLTLPTNHQRRSAGTTTSTIRRPEYQTLQLVLHDGDHDAASCMAQRRNDATTGMGLDVESPNPSYMQGTLHRTRYVVHNARAQPRQPHSMRTAHSTAVFSGLLRSNTVLCRWKMRTPRHSRRSLSNSRRIPWKV